jgi:hypothetical protein
MLHLLKAAALGAILSANLLTLSSAPATARETGVTGSAQTLGTNANPHERSTLTAPSLPDDTPAVEEPSRGPRWVLFDFATGIKTVEFADGSLHEELFEPETLAQMALPTVPAVRVDAEVTGSVGAAPR